jgi:hypothetical protein
MRTALGQRPATPALESRDINRAAGHETRHNTQGKWTTWQLRSASSRSQAPGPGGSTGTTATTPAISPHARRQEHRPPVRHSFRVPGLRLVGTTKSIRRNTWLARAAATDSLKPEGSEHVRDVHSPVDPCDASGSSHHQEADPPLPPERRTLDEPAGSNGKVRGPRGGLTNGPDLAKYAALSNHRPEWVNVPRNQRRPRDGDHA